VEGVALTGAVIADFWRGRNVLLTGHTGFKGGWTALWLARMGAQVTGLALPPDCDPSLFALAGIGRDVDSKMVDLKDSTATKQAVHACAPEIVLHLAAQAIVRRAAREPAETFATNVIGTVHLLEALRDVSALKAVLVVTSDKVYKNDDSGRPFKEDDPLGGHEPYSASKAAAEWVARSYGDLYFEPNGIALATARGGNVLGGGDFAQDRLVPDIVRASFAGADVVLRHPNSTRPWQHVLDCVGGYLCYAQALVTGKSVPRALNFGPASLESITVAEVAAKMLTALPGKSSFVHGPVSGLKESKYLSLDSSLARRALGWSERYRGNTVLEVTSDWYRKFLKRADMRAVSIAEIDAFMLEIGG
jgi:CDP-glucose 4,6-dehydratase